MNKEVKQLIELAEDHGFTHEGRTGSGHQRLRHKGGQVVILSSSPNGGKRWRQNTLSRIQRIDKDSASG